MKRLLGIVSLFVMLGPPVWSLEVKSRTDEASRVPPAKMTSHMRATRRASLPTLRQTPVPLVLKNVGIVGLAGDIDQSGRDVFIQGEKISAIRATGSRPYGEAQVFDCSGKWLIPGLIDMRVYLEFADPQDPMRQRDLQELFSYGITSVLDLSGAPALSEPAEKKVTPRIFSGSAPMRSQPVAWSLTTNPLMNNDKEARQAVQSAKQQGALLLYLDANLETGAVKAALQAAAASGAITAGIFLASSFEEAARGGVNMIYGTTSLLSGFIDGGERKNFSASWSRAEEALLAPKNSVAFFKAWQKVDLQKNARKKLQVLANQAVFFVPSLALESNRLVEFAQTSAGAHTQKLQEKYQQLLRMAFDLQIPLLAGSGYHSQQNWRPRLHEELEAWVAAGIEPRFALEAATINAGHALRQTNLGQVGEGMLADLVICETHPLKNIATLRQPAGVIARGKLFAQKELVELHDLNRIAEREIRAVLAWQVQAWNDGDLERFMRGYWKNDSTIFASGGNFSSGWQEMFARYKKGYPTLEQMGQLEFKIHKVDMMGEAWAKVLGQWKLAVGKTTPQGLFTLILRRFNDGWRIVHDHTSSAAP